MPKILDEEMLSFLVRDVGEVEEIFRHVHEVDEVTVVVALQRVRLAVGLDQEGLPRQADRAHQESSQVVALAHPERRRPVEEIDLVHRRPGLDHQHCRARNFC